MVHSPLSDDFPKNGMERGEGGSEIGGKNGIGIFKFHRLIHSTSFMGSNFISLEEEAKKADYFCIRGISTNGCFPLILYYFRHTTQSACQPLSRRLFSPLSGQFASAISFPRQIPNNSPANKTEPRDHRRRRWP